MRTRGKRTKIVPGATNPPSELSWSTTSSAPVGWTIPGTVVVGGRVVVGATVVVGSVPSTGGRSPLALSPQAANTTAADTGRAMAVRNVRRFMPVWTTAPAERFRPGGRDVGHSGRGAE